MTVLLQLTGVSKSYGALKAVDTVDLAVEAGEALAVIGPNGAGKTTLFNLITGDVAPSGGRVLFDGADMTAMAPHAPFAAGHRPLVSNPASVRQHERVRKSSGRRHLRRRRNRARKLPALQRRAASITGLYDKANVPARTLTLLQRKRLELARALAIEPKLLLLDEIAGGLTEYECGELVKTIKRNSRARHDDRVDRAYRACAGLGGEPADRDEFRPDSSPRASRAR